MLNAETFSYSKISHIISLTRKLFIQNIEKQKKKQILWNCLIFSKISTVWSDMVTFVFCYIVSDSLNLRVFSQNDCIISLTLNTAWYFDTCKGVMCHNIMEYNIMFGYTIPPRDLLCQAYTLRIRNALFYRESTSRLTSHVFCVSHQII